MIRLSGKRIGTDIEISYVGLRPGEKMTEELFLEDERPMPTPHKKLLLARSVDLDQYAINAKIDDLAALAARFDQDRLLTELKRLVPEFEDEKA